MFEKEAEEYADKDFGMYEPTDHERYAKETDWRNGAEFGYNKALEQCAEKFAESNRKWQEVLDKANEWHYVKDGDLPDEDDVYLVYTTKGVLLGHYEQGGADGETTFYGEPYSDFTEYPSEMLFTEDEIIAWKEIVLPKESE